MEFRLVHTQSHQGRFVDSGPHEGQGHLFTCRIHIRPYPCQATVTICFSAQSKGCVSILNDCTFGMMQSKSDILQPVARSRFIFRFEGTLTVHPPPPPMCAYCFGYFAAGLAPARLQLWLTRENVLGSVLGHGHNVPGPFAGRDLGVMGFGDLAHGISNEPLPRRTS